MPHIRAIFPQTSSPKVRLFLEKNKGIIRDLVSRVTGYDKKLIAFIPEPISKEDMYCADNVLPLELVVEAGIKVLDHNIAEEWAKKIKIQIIASCDRADTINFGVWLRAYHVNGYSDYKPKAK